LAIIVALGENPVEGLFLNLGDGVPDGPINGPGGKCAFAMAAGFFVFIIQA